MSCVFRISGENLNLEDLLEVLPDPIKMERTGKPAAHLAVECLKFLIADRRQATREQEVQRG